MDELIKIIIGISGTVIGGFLGYFIRLFIEHRLAIDRIKENIKITGFNHAAAKLRAAFAPALAMIYLARHHGTHDRPDDDRFIKDNLLLHAAAVEEFRPFVPRNIRDEYQQAWEEYRQAARDDIYMRAAEERIVKEEENRDVAYGEIIEKRIHEVLEYAEIK